MARWLVAEIERLKSIYGAMPRPISRLFTFDGHEAAFEHFCDISNGCARIRFRGGRADDIPQK